MKLLLVEDDPLIADQITEDITEIYPDQLSVVGPYTNFDSAVAGLVKEKPSLAILDITLRRDRDAGIRLAEAINQIFPIPFIFLTGLPDRKGFDKAKHTLPIAFLKKPYEKDGLKRALDLTIMHVEESKTQAMTNATAVIKPLQEHSIWVTTARNEQELLRLHEILYFQVQDHYIKAFRVSSHSVVIFKSSLKELYWNNLSIFDGFFYLDRSHLINLKYVTSVKNNQIHLTDELYFSIPKNSRAKLYEHLGITAG
jgi:DNA-binding LytR/AlgR family response regulator